jgi:hypothetical protein
LAPEQWLCVDDFNKITTLYKKSSTSLRPPHQMQAFKLALEDSNLFDLGFMGPRFTWCNWQSEGAYTQERLDKVVANVGWNTLFDVVEVHVLDRSIADHNPLWVNFSNTKDIK